MRATSKLAGFAAVLLLVFGGAIAAGGAIGPERDGSGIADEDDAMSAHGGEAAGEKVPDPVRGLAVSEGGVSIGTKYVTIEMSRSRMSGRQCSLY